MGDSLFNKLLSGIEWADLVCFGMEQALIEIDKCLVLHFTEAPIACPVQLFVLLAQFDLVLGAVLAHWDATPETIMVFFAKKAHLFERSEWR